MVFRDIGEDKEERLPGEYRSGEKVAARVSESYLDPRDNKYRLVPSRLLVAEMPLDAADRDNPDLEVELWVEGTEDGTNWRQLLRTTWRGGSYKDRDGNTVTPASPMVAWASTQWDSIAKTRLNWSQSQKLTAAPTFTEGEYLHSIDAHHSIAVDAVGSGQTTGTTLTISHTVAGSDRYLLAGGAGNWPATDINSITYNTDALTELVATDITGGNGACEIYGIVAPDTGTNDLVITYNNGGDGNIGHVISLTGVDQSTPIGTGVSAAGTGTTITVNVSSASGELVVDIAVADADGSSRTLTVGADQTQRSNLQTTNLGGIVSAMSTEPGAGTVTMSWAVSASLNWATVAVPVKPSAGAATVVQDLIGVGFIPGAR